MLVIYQYHNVELYLPSSKLECLPLIFDKFHQAYRDLAGGKREIVCESGLCFLSLDVISKF